MSLTACLEVCTQNICYVAGCSTTNISQSSKTEFSVINNIDINNTFVNATQLPCTKQVVVHIDEVSFAVCFVIILFLIVDFTIYAICKKCIRKHGNFQSSSA